MSKLATIHVTTGDAAPVLFRGQNNLLRIEIQILTDRPLALNAGDGVVVTGLPVGIAPMVTDGAFTWGAIGSNGTGLVAESGANLRSSDSAPLRATIKIDLSNEHAGTASETLRPCFQAYNSKGERLSTETSLLVTLAPPPETGTVPVVAGVLQGATLVLTGDAAAPVANVPTLFLVDASGNHLVAGSGGAKVTVTVSGLDSQHLKNAVLDIAHFHGNPDWSFTTSSDITTATWTASFAQGTRLMNAQGRIDLRFSGLVVTRSGTPEVKFAFTGVQGLRDSTPLALLTTAGPYTVVVGLDSNAPEAKGFRSNADGSITVVIRPEDTGERLVPLVVTVTDNSGQPVSDDLGVLGLQWVGDNELEWYRHVYRPVKAGSQGAFAATQTLEMLQRQSASIIATTTLTLDVIDLTKPQSQPPDLRGLDLHGVNFDQMYLAQAKFAGAILAGASFTSATLTGADFSNATLRGSVLGGADFTGANLTGVDFSSANLDATILISTTLTGANFMGANLAGSDFSKAVLKDLNFSNMNLAGLKLVGADLSGAILKSAKLAGADLTKSSCPAGDFSGADLSKAIFNSATLAGANLSGANLNATDFTNATLTDVDFRSMSVENTNFFEARLQNVKFDNATLVNVGFRLAKLGGASFVSAKVTDPDFSWADLTGASFRSATITGTREGSASFYSATLKRADFASAFLGSADFGSATAQETNFSGANLSDVTGDDVDFSNAKFTGAVVSGGVFPRAKLSNADFTNARVTGTTFSGAAVDGTNISGALLDGVAGLPR